MTYGHTTVSIDKDMIQKAKELEINISEVLRTALAVKLDEAENDQLDRAFVDLQNAKRSAEEGISKINEIYKLREENRIKKIKVLEDTYSPITELVDLTPEQMLDVQYMMKLIELLRAKYNNRFISVSGIKEYCMLKASNGLK
jgi:hypothetical protein